MEYEEHDLSEHPCRVIKEEKPAETEIVLTGGGRSSLGQFQDNRAALGEA